jgi:hypothetical protein
MADTAQSEDWGKVTCRHCLRSGASYSLRKQREMVRLEFSAKKKAGVSDPPKTLC